MGALSHSLQYQTSFMDVGLKVPDGVEYPGRPVDTRQSYFFDPSTKTDIFCLALSMAMRTWEPLVPEGPGWACPTVDVGSEEHTLAASSQRKPGLSQSALVRGWLGV